MKKREFSTFIVKFATLFIREIGGEINTMVWVYIQLLLLLKT
jgi:hypothetical protein